MSITHITFSSQNWAEKHHKGFDKIVSVYDQGARDHVLGIDHLDQSYTKTYRIKISTSSQGLVTLARMRSPLSSYSARQHHQNPF